MATAAQKFGDYELLERIGYGGMAEVFRARYTPAQGVTKAVVIKRILPHLADNQNFVSMFNSEARISMGLSHGNIAQIFDFGQVDGKWFLAMEFVDGQPLSSVLQRAQEIRIPFLPPSIAVHVAIEMCKGLHYAHTRTDEYGRLLKIVHRDVSPDNVLLSYEGQVKLVDFGIAKARLAGRLETEPGVVRGKYMFLSPEQARGEVLDSRADVFATGVLLFRMLSGRLPVEGTNEFAVMSLIAQGKLPRLREVNPEVPRELDEILVKAMATDRRERYGSCLEFQDALTLWLNERDPRFSASALANLMGYLFRAELTSEGRPPRVPREFSDRAEKWKRAAPPSGQVEDPTATDPTLQSSSSNSVTIRAEAMPTDPTTRLPRPRPPLGKGVTLTLVGAGLAALAAFALVVSFLRSSGAPPVTVPLPVQGSANPGGTGANPGGADPGDARSRWRYAELMDEGRQALKSGQITRAKALFERALAIIPSTEAKVQLGIALVGANPDKEAYARAVQLLEDGVADEPRNAPAWLVLAVADHSLGQVEKARVAYGQYRKLDGGGRVAAELKAVIPDIGSLERIQQGGP